MKPRLLNLFPLLLTAAVIWMGSASPPPVPPEKPAAARPPEMAAPRVSPPAAPLRTEAGAAARGLLSETAAARAACDDFRQWWRRVETVSSVNQAEGLALLERRREALLTLLRHDPAAAWGAALTFAEREQLPVEWHSRLEERFSTIGEIRVLSSCGTPGPSPVVVIPEGAAGPLKGRVWGELEQARSKRAVPVEGIALEGWTALAENGVRPVEGAELEAVLRKFPEAARVTPESSADAPAALIGGKVHRFADARALSASRSLLGELMALPGPRSAEPFTAALGEAEPPATDTIRRQAMIAASSWTETPKSVLVLNAVFPDQPVPVGTPAEWRSVMQEVSGWLSRNSYGKTSLTVTIPPNAFMLPSPGSVYESDGDYPAISEEARAQALAAGFDPDLHDIIIVAFPKLQLGWAGRASVGGEGHWLNGTRDPGVICHEFGHNYGVWHASSWDTDDGSVMPSGGFPEETDPRHVEYGDRFSVMGLSGNAYPQGDFSPHAKAALNWITPDQVRTVTAAGTYRIHRFDHTTAGAKPALALKVQREGSRIFWISCRRSFSNNRFLSGGAYVLWEYKPSQCRLLDMTPESNPLSDLQDKEDAALAIGRTFMDPQGYLSITPVAQGGTAPDEWMDVEVRFNTEGNHHPAATVRPPGGPVHARVPVTFSASATDADGDILTYSWDFGNGKAASGAEVAWTFIAGGLRTVTLRVTDGKGGMDLASFPLMVEDPLARMETLPMTVLDGVLFHGLHAAASEYGFRHRSHDGTAWLPGSGEVSFSAAQLAAGPSRIVAVGTRVEQNAGYGAVETSADGRTWTRALLPAQPVLNCVVFADGLFVAGGNGGRILTSPDGLDWTPRTTPVSADILAIAATGTGFIACGARGTILTSPDGAAWIQRATPSDEPRLTSLAVNGSHAACMDNLGNLGNLGNVFWWSEDSGATWTSSRFGVADFFPSLVAFGEGLWVAVENRYQSEVSRIGLIVGVSADGVDWDLLPLIPKPPSGGGFLDAIRVQDGRLWMYSSSGSLRRSGMIPSGNRAPVLEVAWPPGLTAREPSVLLTATARDADSDPVGLFWEQGGHSYDFNPQSRVAFLIGGERTLHAWASDGRGGHTSVSRTYQVDDPLIHWKNISPASWTSADKWRSAARSPARAVLVDGSHAGTAPLGEMTAPGAWTRKELPMDPHSVAWRDGGFVAAGGMYDSSLQRNRSAVIRSADGITWETPQPLTGYQLNGIADAGDAFVAVGASGVIVRSTDGVNWSDIPSGVTRNLDQVAFTGTHGLATSRDWGILLYSSDSGLSWTNASATLGKDLNVNAVFAAGNELFIQSTGGKLRVYSPAAETWKDAIAGSVGFKGLQSIVHHHSLFMGVAVNDDFDLSRSRRFLLVSQDGLSWDGTEMPWSQDIFTLLSSGSGLIAAGAGSIMANITAPPGLAIDRSTLSARGSSMETGVLGAVRLSNTGVGALPWTVTSGAPWLGASPSGGTAGALAEQSVTVSQLGLLPPGTHTGALTFSAPGLPAQTLTVTLTVYEDDHGGSRDRATAAVPGVTQAGRIQAAEDTDWFFFDLTAPGTLAVRTSGALDTLGELWNAAGLMEFDDDDGPDKNFLLERLLLPGRHWVKVRAYGSAEGDYELHSSFTAAGPVFTVTRWGTGAQDGELSLTAATAAGYRYQVQQSADLLSWESLGQEMTASGAETTLSVRPSGPPGARRYFRISMRAP